MPLKKKVKQRGAICLYIKHEDEFPIEVSILQGTYEKSERRCGTIHTSATPKTMYPTRAFTKFDFGLGNF